MLKIYIYDPPGFFFLLHQTAHTVHLQYCTVCTLLYIALFLERSLPPAAMRGVAGLVHEPFANALSLSHTEPLGGPNNAQREEKIYI